tara:strand:- start:1007 stop:1126 length:120 start_codon:yes stop_codon:yes gene_type:complete
MPLPSSDKLGELKWLALLPWYIEKSNDPVGDIALQQSES